MLFWLRFKRLAFVLVSCLLLSVASLVLIQIDPHNTYLKSFRLLLAECVSPLRDVVDWPLKKLDHIFTHLQTQQDLLTENARLRAHQWLLSAHMQKLLQVERDNSQLRHLLDSKQHLQQQVQVATLLAVDTSPAFFQVVLNQGLQDHVAIGQPVLDGYGVMGQVVDVGSKVSVVMLLTDQRSAIPVVNDRTGVRQIAVGTGGGLALLHGASSLDIQPGDRYSSSGLGMRYPVGYPVGVVAKLAGDTASNHQIPLRPAAHVYQSRHVLLVHMHQELLREAVRNELSHDHQVLGADV